MKNHLCLGTTSNRTQGCSCFSGGLSGSLVLLLLEVLGGLWPLISCMKSLCLVSLAMSLAPGKTILKVLCKPGDTATPHCLLLSPFCSPLYSILSQGLIVIVISPQTVGYRLSVQPRLFTFPSVPPLPSLYKSFQFQLIPLLWKILGHPLSFKLTYLSACFLPWIFTPVCLSWSV